MPSPADVLALIKRKAMAYALANGGSEADGVAFGDTLGGISWVESSLGQQRVGDGGQSHGLFHTHVGGRNLSGVGQRASTPQQLAAALSDPNLDIDNSMPELWQHFQRHGGAKGFQRDPGMFVAQVALTGQRPDRAAWEAVTNSGGYRDGVRIAQGQMAAPQRGSPLQAAAGLASNVSAPVAPSVQVNRTPAQGQITSRFGTPFGMDSGATYQGRQYQHFNKGVDFGAPGGSPVTAVVGGRVVFVGDDGAGWGPRVIIQDAEGFNHSYGHLDAGSLAALKGVQEVKTGQQIGTVASGAVGTSTGSHLSYDVSRNGEPVDPSPWLGQNVVDPSIQHDPTKAQVPGYLSGQGGSAMPNGFYGEQLAAAQADYQKYTEEAATLRAKSSRTPEEAARLEELEGDGIVSTGLVGATLERIQAFQKLATDAAPSGQSADPIAQARAIADIRAGRNQQNQWLFDTYIGLLDKTFESQLGVANLMTNIFSINEQNAQAAVRSAIEAGQLNQSGAEAIVQAHAMKQTAEAARAAQVLARAQVINEADWKIAERRLPPGTLEVPFLESDSDLMTVARSLGLSGKGLKVVPTDFDTLDMRNSLNDAEGTVKPIGDFAIPQLEQTVKANQGIQPYKPKRELTREGAGVPAALNLTAEDIVGRIPQGSQAGGFSDDALIAMILGAGQGQAPVAVGPTAPRQTMPAAPTTATPAATPGAPDPQTGPEGAGSTARFPAANVDPAAIQPGTLEYAAMHAGRTDQPAIQPGTPEHRAMHSGGEPSREDELRALLSRFEIPALSSPLTTGAAAGRAVLSRGRRWLK